MGSFLQTSTDSKKKTATIRRSLDSLRKQPTFRVAPPVSREMTPG